MTHYSLLNPKTGTVFYSSDDWDCCQHMWNHIPRRKGSELLWVDNTTGEIVKLKPRKEVG